MSPSDGFPDDGRSNDADKGKQRFLNRVRRNQERKRLGVLRHPVKQRLSPAALKKRRKAKLTLHSSRTAPVPTQEKEKATATADALLPLINLHEDNEEDRDLWGPDLISLAHGPMSRTHFLATGEGRETPGLGYDDEDEVVEDEAMLEGMTQDHSSDEMQSGDDEPSVQAAKMASLETIRAAVKAKGHNGGASSSMNGDSTRRGSVDKFKAEMLAGTGKQPAGSWLNMTKKTQPALPPPLPFVDHYGAAAAAFRDTLVEPGLLTKAHKANPSALVTLSTEQIYQKNLAKERKETEREKHRAITYLTCLQEREKREIALRKRYEAELTQVKKNQAQLQASFNAISNSDRQFAIFQTSNPQYVKQQLQVAEHYTSEEQEMKREHLVQQNRLLTLRVEAAERAANEAKAASAAMRSKAALAEQLVQPLQPAPAPASASAAQHFEPLVEGAWADEEPDAEDDATIVPPPAKQASTLPASIILTDAQRQELDKVHAEQLESIARSQMLNEQAALFAQARIAREAAQVQALALAQAEAEAARLEAARQQDNELVRMSRNMGRPDNYLRDLIAAGAPVEAVTQVLPPPVVVLPQQPAPVLAPTPAPAPAAQHFVPQGGIPPAPAQVPHVQWVDQVSTHTDVHVDSATIIPRVVSPHGHIRMPIPSKYNGSDSKEIVESILFSFENYLTGSGIQRSQWPVAAMPLLEGKALQAWIAFAEPKQSKGEAVSWDDFRTVLTTAFMKPDRARTARSALWKLKQITSVSDYIQKLRILIAQAGGEPPADADLLLHFWDGLKPEIRAHSQIDPKSGKAWDSFESLVSHALTIDLIHRDQSEQPTKPVPRWRADQYSASKMTKLKSVSLKQAGVPQGGRGGGGHGRGGGRGGRGGGGGRGRGAAGHYQEQGRGRGLGVQNAGTCKVCKGQGYEHYKKCTLPLNEQVPKPPPRY